MFMNRLLAVMSENASLNAEILAIKFSLPVSRPLSIAGVDETCKDEPMKLSPRHLLALLLTIFSSLSAFAEEKKATELSVGGLLFKITDGWTSKATPRAMSQGGLTYQIAEMKEGLDADFYHFGTGQGGSVEANVARWKAQFDGGPKEVEAAKLADGKIDFLHLEGTFLSGPAFGQKTPLKDHAMLGAIVDNGDAGAVFIKLTGPKDEVAKAVVAFKALAVSGVQP